MLGEGEVCCQSVVTSLQVSEAKCNHDLDEQGMKKSKRKRGKRKRGVNKQPRCQLLNMNRS